MGKITTTKNGIYCTYIAAKYKTDGNIVGKYKQNIFKGKFTKDICVKLDSPIDYIMAFNVFDKSEKKTEALKSKKANEASVRNVIKKNLYTKEEKQKNVKQSIISKIRFESKGLKAHNLFRSIHGATSMKIDPVLSAEAEIIAKEMADVGHLRHAKPGENLAFGCSSVEGYELSAQEATKRW